MDFLDYGKITDVLMYFTNTITLNISVSLVKRTKEGRILPFHSEFEYTTRDGMSTKSIKRRMEVWFEIKNSEDYLKGVMIRPSDVVFLQILMKDNILPWFMGTTRVFGFNKENKMILNGKYNPVNFVLNERNYLSFNPIICTYNDGTTKEGIRMVINNKNDYVDMDINRFMEFYYYVFNTDLYTAGSIMMNYVKTQPYGINSVNMNNRPVKKQENFFDTI